MKENIVISDYSIAELHQMMRAGETSSFELVSSYFKRIEELNPTLNAIIFENKENALSEAKKADIALKEGTSLGRFHGIPITIKDNIEVTQLPTTVGFKPFEHHISVEDAALVSLLKNEGAIVLGKTNLPALTYDLQTNNRLFGRTNNPWNTDHTSGGSSGGCASAVASAISRISFCNDSGGSIRIPAHFCGVFGFKASMGGISSKGIITQVKKKVGPLKMRTLFSMGMMAQSIEDIRTALQVIGTEKILPPLERNTNLSDLKFLWVDELDGLEVDHDIKKSMGELRSKLSKSGASIDDFTSEQFDFYETIKLWGHLSNYESGNELPPLTRTLGNLIMKRKYSKIPMYADLLKPISKKKYRALRKRHEDIKQEFENLLSNYDGLILPASSILAFPHREPDRRIGHLGIYTTPLHVNGKPVQYAVATQSYSLPFNVLESPVVSLPIALSKNKLPIGIQIVGRNKHDFDLLEIASTLNNIIPHIGKPKI